MKMHAWINKVISFVWPKVICMREEDVTCSRRSSNCTYWCRFLMDHYSEGIVYSVHHTTYNLLGSSNNYSTCIDVHSTHNEKKAKRIHKCWCCDNEHWIFYEMSIRSIELFRSIIMLCKTENILHIQYECRKYSTKYCQFHKTLLWI